MANGQSLANDPEFKNPQYRTVVGSEYEHNGLKAKMIYLATDEKGKPSGLPQYSKESDIYFKGQEMGKALQAKVYKNHRMVLDFDWSHNHRNKGNGETFEAGTIHVQEYCVDNNGNIRRLSNQARLMTIDEIRKYGQIILHFNPKVKFR